MWVSRNETIDSNMRSAFTLIMGQCTKFIRSKIESLHDWDIMKLNFDLLRLIIELKNLSNKYHEGTQNNHVAYSELV